MNILDTNGINHILKNNLTLSDEYFLVPDVAEESELAQMIHRRRMPGTITQLSQNTYFDQVIYLAHYKTILNKYGGRSFYNMTGFGDVSTIAALQMLFDVFNNQSRERLFATTESITVFTDDAGLIAKINAEFVGKGVVVKSVVDIT
ncbi:MAG: hypothetical protein WCO09_00520 [bacterium]